MHAVAQRSTFGNAVDRRVLELPGMPARTREHERHTQFGESGDQRLRGTVYSIRGAAPVDVVIPILVSIAIAGWFSAFVHGFYLWLHPAPGVTSTQLLFAGYRFYNRDSFEPKVWPTHRRFM